MLTTVERILFILLVLASFATAYITFNRMARVIQRGPGKLYFDNLPKRLLLGIGALFGQGQMIRHRMVTSMFHYLVAWGFIFYLLVNVVDVLEGFVAGFHFLGDTVFGNLFRLLADLFSVAVMVGMIYLLLRRFAVNMPSLHTRENVKLHPKVGLGLSRDSLIVGFFILLHVGYRFINSSFAIALNRADPWQPFANQTALFWSFMGLSDAALTVGWHASWWIALGLILLFLPYFPYTKHAHLFMGPFNFMTRPERTSLGTLDPLNFEDETLEQFGAARLTDLSQTQIVDAYACIMCNRCQDACPAYVTGKELSPAALEINKRYYLFGNQTALAAGAQDEPLLLDYAISESAVWACTACGACVDVCPVGNEPMFDILHIRQNEVLMNSSFPQELKAAFTGMERVGNPWNMTNDRLEWARPLNFPVPIVAENPDFEVLYWVGCAGAFDPGAQETARAIATILKCADVNFAVLGNDETCTGDTARRAGNEYLFFELAQANIETLNAAGVDRKTIVTACPHCFHTLGKEYGALGGHYRVLHHTQLIADLIGQGKLRLNGGVLEEATFHDPCYLGRHNGIYEDPRTALARAGMTLLEMGRNRSDSFCCGAGGAQFWKEEEHGSETVSGNRYREAEATGAKTLAVGCPFCARMLGDAGSETGSKMAVKDVAQIVAEGISHQPSVEG
jgi:Fe-S oxidoreductase